MWYMHKEPGMSTAISLSNFLNGISAIAAQSPSYRFGHDGSDGFCDCIGLVIGAIRRGGGSWQGVHGSNYAARCETNSLRALQSANELSVGEVVYKAHEPTESGYNLPSRYANDPDQRDYYHVGVVTSIHPLEITHCTGPGIVRDARLGQWRYHGWLGKVALPSEGVEQTMNIQTATVTASSGSTVNLRSAPNDALVDRLPVGAVVTVIGQQDGWVNVTYGEKSGWMMEQFLLCADENEQLTLTLPRTAAQALASALADALNRG